jgi:hypothetical protein
VQGAIHSLDYALKKKLPNRPKKMKPSQAGWRWVILGDGERLHRVCELNIERIEELDEEGGEGMHGPGKTVCGRTGDLMMAGVISRMGMARCHNCCRAIQMPDGLGNPRNDKRLRKIATR